MSLSFFSLGALHFPVLGLLAALGLMAALLLSQRTARMAGLSPDKVWNAGLFAVISAFVVSRLLFVAFSFASFRANPMLALTLPSLTYTGVWITCLLTYAWLRVKRLPLLPVLDAAAPCATVVWFALSLGHFAEGTDAGMPTRLPWGIITPGDTVLGRVHPVEIYAALAAAWLTLRLLWLLRSGRCAGSIAARGLIAGSVASFLLDFLRQPEESFGNAWLDPSQIIALVLIVASAALLLPQATSAPQTQPETTETASHAQ